MAKYRTMQMNYWNDPYIERLSMAGKLLYVYLITSPHTSNLGILEITTRKISFESGIDVEMVESLLAQMERDGKVVRDGDYIWLVNFVKHQCTVSPKLFESLKGEVAEVKSRKILRRIAAIYPTLGVQYPNDATEADTVSTAKTQENQSADTLSIPYSYPMDTLSIPIREREQGTGNMEQGTGNMERECEGERGCKGEGVTAAQNPEPSLPPDGGSPASPDMPLVLKADKRQETKASPQPPCPHKAIIELYHEILPIAPRVQVWDGASKTHLQRLWRIEPERQSLNWWREFFARVSRSDWLTGKVQGSKTGKPFIVSLDWLVKPENFRKVLNGNYDNRRSAGAVPLSYDEAKRQLEQYLHGDYGSLRDEVEIDENGRVINA